MKDYFLLFPFPLSGAWVSAEADTFFVSEGVSFPVLRPLEAIEATLLPVFSFFAIPRLLVRVKGALIVEQTEPGWKRCPGGLA